MNKLLSTEVGEIEKDQNSCLSKILLLEISDTLFKSFLSSSALALAEAAFLSRDTSFFKEEHIILVTGLTVSKQLPLGVQRLPQLYRHALLRVTLLGATYSTDRG